jgi:hypothetical protein
VRGASRPRQNITENNLFYVLILFYMPFDVECPEEFPAQGAVLDD